MTPLAIAHNSLCLLEPPYPKHYRGGRFKLWNGVALVANSLPGPGFNFAATLRLDSPCLDELLPVASEFFAEATEGWGILVEGDAGHPMETELRDRGWIVAEDEPAFVLADLPTWRTENAKGLVPELSVRQVLTLTDRDAYHSVTTAAFNAPPEFADAMMPSLDYALDPRIGLFVGSVDGTDVCAAGYSRTGSTAVLAGVATLETHRGRRYGETISRFAVLHAADRGCTHASLRSGPKSIPLYERLGFRYVCQHRTYACAAANFPPTSFPELR